MKSKLYCTVDIGGTKILLLLINEDGSVLFREKIATPKPEEPSAVVDVVRVLLNKALLTIDSRHGTSLSGIGVCIAGFVDHNRGLVHQSPNLNWHRPVALGDLLSEAFSAPVLIENDANAAVLGEVFYGAAMGHRDVIYVTISTGIGGGLFLNGQLYRGSNGFAGEIGHIKPFGKGRSCKCGSFDCLETWASGSAIARSAKSLWNKEDLDSAEITTAAVFNEADRGNNLAQNIIEHALENTGRGLSNLVNLFNPACIVIGGGVAGARPEYLFKIASIIKKEAIRPSVEVTPLKIVAAKLEPEAGIWGMFALMTNQVVN
jgi:glucokinase